MTCAHTSSAGSGSAGHQLLLVYFGETLEQSCGTRAAGTARGQADATDSPDALQSAVARSWGSGVVMRYEGDRIVVLFEDVGHWTLSLEAVAVRGLLERA